MIHVEADARDGEIFCDEKLVVGDSAIFVGDWILEPESIQRATCPQCLLRIFMLGDSATIALARMGMKIEARNAEEAS
jgi:hypothetical protein